MNIYDKGFFTVVACAALLVVIAVPLVWRKVPPNPVYGFRTRATMANDTIWYLANAHFGRGLIVTTVLGTGVAAVLYVWRPFPPELFLPVSVLVMAAPGLIAVLATLRYVRSLSDRR